MYGRTSTWVKVLAVVCLAICSVTLIVYLTRGDSSGAGSISVPKSPSSAAQGDHRSVQVSGASASVTAEQGSGPGPLVSEGKPELEGSPAETEESVLGRLAEISSSYDPKKLPLLEPYLYSKDQNIRTAAVNAVVNLGDIAGAEILHRASRSMMDPKEETETLEKAAFLRLPSGRFKGEKKSR